MTDLSITETKEIPISKLELGSDLTRQSSITRDLHLLEESIDAIGLLQPIGVFKNEIKDEESFTVVLGMRRFIACYELGHSKILCNVFNRVLDRDEMWFPSLTENSARRPLEKRDLEFAGHRLFEEFSVDDIPGGKTWRETLKRISNSTGITISTLNSLMVDPAMQYLVTSTSMRSHLKNSDTRIKDSHLRNAVRKICLHENVEKFNQLDDELIHQIFSLAQSMSKGPIQDPPIDLPIPKLNKRVR